MKKNTITRIGIALFILALTFTGCGDKPKQKESNQTVFELSMTEKDTTEVANLVNHFFELLETDRVTDAVAMLYQVNPNSEEKVELLDNANIAKATRLFRSFPIVNHRIEYVKFQGVYSNEVKVSAIIAEATDERPEAKTVFYLKPVDKLGQWCLCLMDTHEGDERIISNEEADSVAEKYTNYQEEKAAEKEKAGN